MKTRARWDREIGWEYIEAAKKAGTFDEADLPPELPAGLDEIWRLFLLVRTQVRMEGGLDYNPAIALVQSVGATANLWKVLELLQVIEVEVLKSKKTETPPGAPPEAPRG